MSEKQHKNSRLLMNHFPGKSVVIGPGQYYVAQEKVTISTLLGSCVAVCLWDSSTGIIGMNHYLLARKARSSAKGCEPNEAGRYGIQAVELLINGMMKIGAQRQYLKAKVFGGASVMGDEGKKGFFEIGEANSRFILEFLETDGIPLVASDLGGTRGRKIYFCSDDFAVYVRKIGKSKGREIAVAEMRFWENITKEKRLPPEPEIWL
jgi:chemotaxis protein CheD